MSQLLNKKQLAEKFGISVSCVDQWIKKGIITPTLDKPKARFTVKDVKDQLKEKK